MNEQKKELMLKAAVQFKGVWPDGAEILLFDGDAIEPAKEYRGNLVRLEDWEGFKIGFDVGLCGWKLLCNKGGFEAFIDSLFEGASEKVNAYIIQDEYSDFAIIDDFNRVKLMPSRAGVYTFFADVDYSVIWRPRGYIKTEWVNSSPRKQEVEPEPIDTEFVEWSGAGLPPVGVECRFDCTARGKVCGNAQGVVKYMSEYTCVMDVGGSEFVAHPDTMKFRPLKTEAEKERDKAIGELEAFLLKNGERRSSRATVANDIATAIHDELGWRPSKD